jgi:hypothetical protein
MGANNPNEKHGTAAGGAWRRLRPRHAVSFPVARHISSFFSLLQVATAIHPINRQKFSEF